MMTQTHTLIAATLFVSSRRPRKHNFAILLGSFVPDAAVFGLFIWSKFVGIPERQLWREIYFSEPMLTFTAIANSLPLYAFVLCVGYFLLRYQTKSRDLFSRDQAFDTMNKSLICLFALAAITHLVGDFPVHASDAHPHLWPITDWRFHSPVSYWDKHHYGNVFSIFEVLLGICLSIILFRRFKINWVRLLTVLALVSYVAVPIYFFIQLG